MEASLTQHPDKDQPPMGETSLLAETSILVERRNRRIAGAAPGK